MYVEIRTVTKQVMVPESYRENFALDKKSSYNERNCESGGNNRRHTFIPRKPWKIHQDKITTCLLNMDLKVKTRNSKETKFPLPRRRDQMIHTIHRRQAAEHLKSIEISQHILPYDEPDLYNGYITKESDYMDCFCINFPRHCVLRHVLSDSDPLDDLGPWKEVVQPTNKPKSAHILDQKRAEAVRILQEHYAFSSNEDFINALECNSIEGVDFRRRDVKIANDIYGYSKGAAMGRFKHPRKGVKMDRTTEDLAVPVHPTIMEYYSDIHLDIDVLFVNKIPFILATSRDIGFIHCKALLSKHGKRIWNGLQQIVLDYEARGFKVVSMFGDREFEPLVNWVQSELHIDLVTCAANSHVPRAKNAIQFVKKMMRAILLIDTRRDSLSKC